MGKQEKDAGESYTVDILHIAKSLWKRAWVIVLCGLAAAAIGFSISAFAIAPTYSSSIQIYVNTSSVSLQGKSISLSDLNAAQKLVGTYGEIMNNRTTLEEVIDRAEVNYTWKQLSKMLRYGPVKETEIMRVTVTCKDPNEASAIANTISEVLKVRISEIIDGASMEVVDSAVPEPDKVAPSITRYTAIGLALGVLVSAAALAIAAVLDDTIHDEEYILRTYDYPILGRVPDLQKVGKSYRYYASGHSETGRQEKGG